MKKIFLKRGIERERARFLRKKDVWVDLPNLNLNRFPIKIIYEVFFLPLTQRNQNWGSPNWDKIGV